MSAVCRVINRFYSFMRSFEFCSICTRNEAETAMCTAMCTAKLNTEVQLRIGAMGILDTVISTKY